jgi:hypothetical protein
MVSMPEMIFADDQNDLNPSIGLTLRLMARWSCSTRLFRYLDWRSSMARPLWTNKAFTAAVLAPLLSIVIFSGTSCRSAKHACACRNSRHTPSLVVSVGRVGV